MRFPPDEVTKVITNQDSLLKAKKLNFLVKALEVMSVDHQGFILWVPWLSELFEVWHHSGSGGLTDSAKKNGYSWWMLWYHWS